MNSHPLYSWKNQPEWKIVNKIIFHILYSSIYYIVYIYIGLYYVIFRLHIRLYIIYVHGRKRTIEEQITNTKCQSSHHDTTIHVNHHTTTLQYSIQRQPSITNSSIDSYHGYYNYLEKSFYLFNTVTNRIEKMT